MACADAETNSIPAKPNNMLFFHFYPFQQAHKEKLPKTAELYCQTLRNQCTKKPFQKHIVTKYYFRHDASLRHHMATPASTKLTKNAVCVIASIFHKEFRRMIC
ncbi:hypothetical protein SEETMRM10607_12350 [Salmonella enterica subsp. enterica serovar Typhimurium]|nr:hypothetical protein SEETMRM10607_12350 [Salmonella enterica subsp. enterica serovar Typhimurium]